SEIEARIAELERQLPERFPPEERITLITPPATEWKTESGTEPELLSDGSYRFTGETPDKDVWVFVLESPLTNHVLLNLDALADESLPQHGPGRADNGNFVLSEIQIVASPRGDKSGSNVVEIASASADFEQRGFPV